MGPPSQSPAVSSPNPNLGGVDWGKQCPDGWCRSCPGAYPASHSGGEISACAYSCFAETKAVPPPGRWHPRLARVTHALYQFAQGGANNKDGPAVVFLPTSVPCRDILSIPFFPARLALFFLALLSVSFAVLAHLWDPWWRLIPPPLHNCHLYSVWDDTTLHCYWYL
jgi:hypothetical protein